jgi:O-succinylbenzoate synthase
MRLSNIELRRIHLELVTPFRTSFGEQTAREILLIGVTSDDGTVGWGECVAMSEPLYSPEYVAGVETVISEFIAPRISQQGDLIAGDIAEILKPIKGHQMAKAAIEMAVLDAELRIQGINLHARFGGSRATIPSGVSVGIFSSIDALLSAVQGYVDDGYARIKLKIEPGWDIEPVRLVRELIGPEMGLQVDANTAYTRRDFEHLRQLDAYDLLLIEQPLDTDDLLGHRDLAAAIDTPVCLDESIESFVQAEDAIAIGAAEIINIKPGRVGGYLEAVRIHDLCVANGIPVWCGGMLETGIGRAANCALAALDGFVLPGDISASRRFYSRDIVLDPIEVNSGEVAVPSAPGLGYDLDSDFLESITTSVQHLSL